MMFGDYTRASCSLLFVALFGVIGFVFQLKFAIADSQAFEGGSICVIGSSGAAGYGASSPDKSWVGRVANVTKNNVVNQARPGAMVSLALQGCPSGINCDLCSKANIVLISFPTNDIAYGANITEVVAIFKKIDDFCTKEKRKCFVIGVQPRNYPSNLNQNLRLLDKELAQLFSDKYINLYEILEDSIGGLRSDLSLSDGIHLNDLGHRVVADAVLNMLFKTSGK